MVLNFGKTSSLFAFEDEINRIALAARPFPYKYCLDPEKSSQS